MKAKSLFMRLMRLFVLLLLCASLAPSRAQAANGSFAWAKSMGSVDADVGTHVEVDAAGNIYTTGHFEGTVDFDPGPGTSNLTSAGFWDIFVSKVDSNGDFVWARGMGGANFEDALSLAVDASGNVYTTGYFQETADFDPGPGVSNLTLMGIRDIFISKLDSNGSFVWAKNTGGIETVIGFDIAVDPASNVYITGDFEGTVDFDPSPSTYNLTSAGNQDIFVVKLGSNGNLLWARTMGGSGADAAHGLAVDAGGVYTTGYFQGSADFDPGPGTASPTSAGAFDIFVSKLDRDGNFVWARGMGGTGLDRADDLVVDSGGSVYTTGFFSGTADFDPGTGTVSLASMGPTDMFISKLDSSGSFVWARSIGGTSPEVSRGLAVDAGGNVYTAGTFEGTADFDPGAGAYSLTSAGVYDIFISKLNSNGNFLWARGIGGTGSDAGLGLDLDVSGNIYMAGQFSDTVDFDPGGGTTNLTSAGASDIFIAKFQETAIFGDAPLGYWALDFIERLYGAGITGGCSTSPLNYCPEQTVTRAQMAVFLERGIRGPTYSPPSVSGGTGFSDVPADYWAGAWIKQLAADGITGGCGSGTYCPESPVTRAQMAVFLLRSKHGASYSPPAVGSSTGFTDVPPSYWAAAWIKQLVSEGITTGCGAGTYCPEAPVTRAQMAVFLVRTFNLP